MFFQETITSFFSQTLLHALTVSLFYSYCFFFHLMSPPPAPFLHFPPCLSHRPILFSHFSAHSPCFLSLSGSLFVFFSVMLPLSFSSLYIYPSLSVTVCYSRVVESAGVTGNRVPWVLWTQLLGSGNCLHNRKSGGLVLSCPTFKRVCGCEWGVRVFVCACVCASNFEATWSS